MNTEYIKNFNAAISRTKKYNLINPDTTSLRYNQSLLTDSFATKIADEFSATFKDWSNENFVGQCLKSHVIFLPKIERLLGEKVTFTIGFIESNKQDYFKFSEKDAEDWISRGMPKNTANVHAWLTLPSSEIIDLTFLPTFAKINEMKVPKGSLIANYSSNLDGMKYIPMFVGVDFLQKIGALKFEIFYD